MLSESFIKDESHIYVTDEYLWIICASEDQLWGNTVMDQNMNSMWGLNAFGYISTWMHKIKVSFRIKVCFSSFPQWNITASLQDDVYRV